MSWHPTIDVHRIPSLKSSIHPHRQDERPRVHKKKRTECSPLKPCIELKRLICWRVDQVPLFRMSACVCQSALLGKSERLV